jgi:hypothetical protein
MKNEASKYIKNNQLSTKSFQSFIHNETYSVNSMEYHYLVSVCTKQKPKGCAYINVTKHEALKHLLKFIGESHDI